jgi:hypothetical protein
MHTTFIPILLFSILLILASLAKAFLNAAAHIMQDAAKPHYLSPWQLIGGTVMAATVILTGLTTFADAMREHAKRSEPASISITQGNNGPPTTSAMPGLPK